MLTIFCRELIEGGTEEDKSLGRSDAVVPIADPEATAREAIRLFLDEKRWQQASDAGLAMLSRKFDRLEYETFMLQGR